MGAESDAIRERYARRAAADVARRYGPFQPDDLLRAQANERALVALLRSRNLTSVGGLSVLEIGCGEGISLLQLIRLGFDPARMVGNDLREDALEAAGRILPASVRFVAGEASVADFGGDRFDIVAQSTVFSSILDPALQGAVAERMWSLTRPGGAVLWYDLALDNPWNPDVRGVPLARVRTLFPEAAITARRVTLAPPIARAAARVHAALYRLLDAMPWLRSHLLCWIARPGA
jgi:SAM-dependent methyltransferase